MSIILQERIKTLSATIEGFDPSRAEDVTCENFMTVREGCYSVLYDGTVYDWTDGVFVARTED